MQVTDFVAALFFDIIAQVIDPVPIIQVRPFFLRQHFVLYRARPFLFRLRVDQEFEFPVLFNVDVLVKIFIQVYLFAIYGQNIVSFVNPRPGVPTGSGGGHFGHANPRPAVAVIKGETKLRRDGRRGRAGRWSNFGMRTFQLADHHLQQVGKFIIGIQFNRLVVIGNGCV